MKGLSRYAAVGAVATAGHYALLVLLVEVAHMAPGPAALLGALFGAMLAYWGNRRFTFSGTRASHATALPRFSVIAGLGALANAAIVGGGVAVGAHYLLMQALATVLVMMATFHLNRRWTFRTPD